MKKLCEEIITKHNAFRKNINSTAGITLIALVITIIVLLILARNQYFNAIWR